MTAKITLTIIACLIFAPDFALSANTFAIDGDTAVINGETIRILNIDTPEIRQAKCESELAAGLAAKQRMAEMLRTGPITIIRGDNGRMTDKYGRTLARLVIDGQDLGEQMVLEGLARRWDGRRHPWCR
jgi:micrococcal nuclease